MRMNLKGFIHIQTLSISVCLPICLSVWVSGFMYVCMYVCMSICMYVYLYVCLSVCEHTNVMKPGNQFHENQSVSHIWFGDTPHKRTVVKPVMDVVCCTLSTYKQHPRQVLQRCISGASSEDARYMILKISGHVLILCSVVYETLSAPSSRDIQSSIDSRRSSSTTRSCPVRLPL